VLSSRLHHAKSQARALGPSRVCEAGNSAKLEELSLMALRIAYLILAHKSTSQVVRLVQRLQGDDRTFVIHVDLNSPSVEWEMARAILNQPNVFWADRITCTWGSFSLVQATLSCIEALQKFAPPADFVVHLSGQDYPVRPSGYIEDFLAARKGTCLMYFHRFPYPQWDLGGYYRLPTWRIPTGGKGLRVVPSFLSPVFHRKVPQGYHPCGGSQWWALPGEAVEYLWNFLGSNPEFVSYFQKAIFPDEMLFHTILGNSRFPVDSGDHHLHYMRWLTIHASSPELLTVSDLPAMRASGKCFARKFEYSVTNPVLDLIDEEFLRLPPFREPELTNSAGS
jgi:hypothetical protein